MGMTMTQKILAAHAGLDSVEAGQLIEAKLDVVMANDITCLLYTSYQYYEGNITQERLPWLYFEPNVI